MTTLNEILAGPPNRPNTPDFWRLSEIILELKADMQETEGDPQEQERRWRKHYEDIGDFDSIAYCAIQAAMQVNGIQSAADFLAMKMNQNRLSTYISCVQTYFDGFAMGAEFVHRGGHRDG